MNTEWLQWGVAAFVLVGFVGFMVIKKYRARSNAFTEMLMSRPEQHDPFSTDDGVLGPVITRVSAVADLDVVVINVFARGNGFRGSSVFSALKGLHCQYTDKGIFEKHYPEVEPSMYDVMYRVVSSTEPGTFTEYDMDQQLYKGLTFIMMLPTRHDPGMVFESMLSSAKQLARLLGGDLYDQQRRPLTKIRLDNLLDQIEDMKQSA